MKHIALTAFLLFDCSARAEAISSKALVIDGDTIYSHSTRIRLYAIDGVESNQQTYFTGGNT